jgi:hypothetical protein
VVRSHFSQKQGEVGTRQFRLEKTTGLVRHCRPARGLAVPSPSSATQDLRPGLIIWRPCGTSIIKDAFLADFARSGTTKSLVIKAFEFGVVGGLLPLLPKAGEVGHPALPNSVM